MVCKCTFWCEVVVPNKRLALVTKEDGRTRLRIAGRQKREVEIKRIRESEDQNERQLGYGGMGKENK